MSTNPVPEAVKLLPCPFCGGAASGDGHIRWSSPLTDTWWADGSPVTEAYFVNCMPCGARACGGVIGGHQSKAEAITKWNTRASSEKLAEVEAERDAAWYRLGTLELKPNLAPDLVALIARLGTMYSHRGDGIPTQFVNPDGPDAAAAIEGLNAQRDALQRQLDEARAVIDKHGRHDGLCARIGGYGFCSCGLEDAVRALSKQPESAGIGEEG